MPNRGQMERAVADAVRTARIGSADAAAVQLARRYAQLMDKARDDAEEAVVYDRLGPKLLAVLTSLGLTAAGRDGFDAPAAAAPDGPAARTVVDLKSRARARRAGAAAR
jgi:hypothetical protein